MTNQNSPGNREIAEKLIAELNDHIEWTDSGGDSGCGEQYLMGKAEEVIIKALDAKDLAHKEEVEKLHHDLFVEQQYSSLQFDENRKLQGEVGALTKNLNEMGWAAKWRTSRDEQIIKLSSDLKMAVEALEQMDIYFSGMAGGGLDEDANNAVIKAKTFLSKLSVKEKT